MIDFSITAMLALGMLLIIVPGAHRSLRGQRRRACRRHRSVLVFEQGWPAPLAMGAAFVVGVLMLGLHGQRHRAAKAMPAFIITLGGLLVFKGLFWLRDPQLDHSDRPPADEANLYSLLTTYYLPPAARLRARRRGHRCFRRGPVSKLRAQARWRIRIYRRRRGAGCSSSSFSPHRSFFLFVLVTNQFRGCRCPRCILGAHRVCGVDVLTATHAVWALPLRHRGK